MKTQITELFGIEHPIIQGGMHFVGFAELAAAVSNAGGLGIITGLTQGTPEKLDAEIKKCQALTDKPFGVNLTFLPSMTPPDYPGLIEVIINNGVKVVETAGRNPAVYMPAMKDAGIKVIHKCTSVRHSIKAQDIGCDAVSVDGPRVCSQGEFAKRAQGGRGRYNRGLERIAGYRDSVKIFRGSR